MPAHAQLGVRRGIYEELQLAESTFTIDMSTYQMRAVTKAAISYPTVGKELIPLRTRPRLLCIPVARSSVDYARDTG